MAEDRFEASFVSVIVDELIEDINFINDTGEKCARIVASNIVAASALKTSQPSVRITNYYESIIPRYSDKDFKAHFRMYRDTFEKFLLSDLKMTQLETPSVSEFEKGNPKFAEQELLKIENGGLPVCVSDERGDQENIFINEIDSGYDLHSLDTFEYGNVAGNGAFYRKHKLEMFDETEIPQHVSSLQHSKVLDEYNACVMDTEQTTHDDKILKLKIYGEYPLLASETSEQESVDVVDLKHARRGKVDSVAVSILSKETEPGQIRIIWCISLLIHQVVKQVQSKCLWLLLLLSFLQVITGETSPCVQVQENGTATLEFYYDLNITQHTIEAYLDHCPPNTTNFENLADVAQNYKNVITIVAVAALLLLALIIGIVVCFKCPKIYKAAVRLMKGCQCQFNSCCKTTASATENNAQDHIAENQPLQGNNGTD